MSDMLREVARSVDAIACILWQEVPEFSQLFVLADGVLGKETSYLHNLSILQSATGQAILSRQAVTVNNVETDSRVDRRDPFLAQAKIKCFCSIPLTSLGGYRGALNAYRTSDRPFQQAEVEWLEQLARLIPSLYESITDRVSYRLVREVNQILPEHGNASGTGFRQIGQKLCESIASRIGAMEVSLFLEDRFTKPEEYRMAATTWRELKRVGQLTYAKNPENGLIGWVLARCQPLRLLDLTQFEREKHKLRSLYSGLTLLEPQKFERALRKTFKVAPNEALPPISFVAVPIIAAGHLLGAIRCCAALGSPYYFAEREVRLLELVADQIGQAWNGWLSRREIQEENGVWKILVDSMRDLNVFVAEQVDKGSETSEPAIFNKALEIVHRVIPGAEISDVRLRDEKQNDLYFAATHGKAWSRGEPFKAKQRMEKRFPLDGSCASGGAKVMSTGEVYLIADTRDPQYLYTETFEEARRMIIAPIRVAKDLFGVLDIRSTSEREFPANAVRTAELLGQQLGLYHHLLRTFSDWRSFQRAQAQAFEDFTHQIKSPIVQVHARTQSCLRLGPEGSIAESIRAQMLAIRGLAAKATSVSQALGLFSDLAQNKSLRPTLSRLSVDFVRTVIEAAADEENTIDPDSRIRFHVDREGFDVLRSYSVLADPSLLLQALSNLLDNAAKYSSSNSVTRIQSGLTATGRFHITVTNQGIPLERNEIRFCRDRGWRSKRAEAVTGEGSGIGLWIVDHIMKAHHGELLVVPTTPDGYTEVKLIFQATVVK